MAEMSGAVTASPMAFALERDGAHENAEA